MASGLVTSIVVIPTEQEYDALEALLKNHRTSNGVHKRARIVLLLTRGESISEISRKVQYSRKAVYKWIERFQKESVAGLKDKRYSRVRRNSKV